MVRETSKWASGDCGTSTGVRGAYWRSAPGHGVGRPGVRKRAGVIFSSEGELGWTRMFDVQVSL